MLYANTKNIKNKKGPQEKTRGPKGETRNALPAHNFKIMATIKPTRILSQSLTMKKHLGDSEQEQLIKNLNQNASKNYLVFTR